jgi:hypothetical protein
MGSMWVNQRFNKLLAMILLEALWTRKANSHQKMSSHYQADSLFASVACWSLYHGAILGVRGWFLLLARWKFSGDSSQVSFGELE